MLLDAYDYIQLEQTGYPGNIGDSAAETGRYITLSLKNVRLILFITDKGILRHPASPWREDDTSSDQVAPLLAAASLTGQNAVADKIISLIKENGYKTGNGQLITPGLFANIRRHQKCHALWLSDLAILGQTLLFKLPIRWSDSSKWFESNSNSSADYLNFINALVFAKRQNSMTFVLNLTLKLTSYDVVFQKIKDYYKPEPNSEWLIDLYEQNLKSLYGVSK